MALSEINAAVNILSKAIAAAFTIKNNFRQVSEAVRSFQKSVKLFQEQRAQWEQILRKHPLQEDHPLRTTLEKAVNEVHRAQKDFQALQQSNCCLRWWNKTWSPELWTTLGKDVNDALMDIFHYLEEKQRIEHLVEEELNKVKVPLAFSSDKRYVPIRTTVEKISNFLEDDDSVNNFVLLYGPSGTGKSALVKYLALNYSEKPKVSSSSSANKSFDVVIFISCGKNSDSLSAMKKIWVDLGYNLDVKQIEGLQEDGQDRRTKIDQFKRMLMTRFGNGKEILIILDDVWNSKLIEDLIMRLKGVKYLITSQNKRIWSDGVDLVPIGTPTKEEARKILANHIIGWGDELFPVEVEKEVDGLIGDVQNHPLVLANLATLVKCEKVEDPRTWTQLKGGLKNAIRAVDQSNTRPKPTVFDQAYEGKLEASLTMAIDLISENARSLLFVLAIGGGDGVDENILKLWFNVVRGQNMFMYNSAYEELEDRALMSIVRTKVTRRNELRNVCSIHDLRRELLREVNSIAIRNILQKLIRRESGITSTERDSSNDRSEEDLVAALIFIYSDMKDSEYVQKRIQIHTDLLHDDGTPEWKQNRDLNLKFMKGFARLLHHAMDEPYDWEKATHELVKTVILHFLQFLRLKDEAMLKLLGIPGSFEATCFVFQYRSPGFRAWTIPKTVNSLVRNLSNHIPQHIPSQIDLGNLGTSLEVFHHLLKFWEEGDFILVIEPQLLSILRKVLGFLRKERSSPAETSTVVSRAALDEVQKLVMIILGKFSWTRKNRVHVRTTPQMMETLLSLLDANLRCASSPQCLELSTLIFLTCSDADIKAKTILLPDVIKTLVSLLSVTPKLAVEALQGLAWTSRGAELISSYPGALDELLRLLADGSKVQTEAVICLGQLASFGSTRTIIESKCPLAFRKLIDLLHQDSPPDLLYAIALAVRKIVSKETDFSRRFLAEVLQRIDSLLADNIGVTIRGRAMEAAVEILASKKAMCNHLETYPGLLEQIFKVPASSEVNAEYITHVNKAVKGIFIQGKALGVSRRMTLVERAVKMYTTLLMLAEVESEIKRKLAQGLVILSHKKEFRNVLTEAGAERIIVIQMRNDPTFYMSETGARIVEDIVFRGASLTHLERADLVAEVLDFYVDHFRKVIEVQKQENLIRAIASLAYWQEIRKLLSKDTRMEKLLEHVASSASPVVIECIGKIIYRVCCTEWNEEQRETFLAKTLERYASLLGDGMKSEIQEAATLGLVILASRGEIRTLILGDQKLMNLIVGLLEEHATGKTLSLVVYLLQNSHVTEAGEEEMGCIKFMEKAVRRLVALLADGIPITVQARALRGLGQLAFRHENGEWKIAYPMAVHQLASCLTNIQFEAMVEEVCEVVESATASRADTEDLQQDMYGLRSYALKCCLSVMEDDIDERQQVEACECLAKLLCYEANRELFESVCPTGQACLGRIVNTGYGYTVYWPMVALTLLDPKREEITSRVSWRVLAGEGYARIHLKQYTSALELYERALDYTPDSSDLSRKKGFIKSQLGDVTGAMEDLNQAVFLTRTAFNVQERGVLKILMEDYEGALTDLNESLRINPEPDDYEMLKHRGYAKFRLGDEDGARFDAQQALSMTFGKGGKTLVYFNTCWGTSRVKYLEFDL